LDLGAFAKTLTKARQKFRAKPLAMAAAISFEKGILATPADTARNYRVINEMGE
jgi:hypothetical protein